MIPLRATRPRYETDVPDLWKRANRTLRRRLFATSVWSWANPNVRPGVARDDEPHPTATQDVGRPVTVTFVHTVGAGGSGSICGLFWTPSRSRRTISTRSALCHADDAARGNSFKSGAEIDRATHRPRGCHMGRRISRRDFGKRLAGGAALLAL